MDVAKLKEWAEYFDDIAMVLPCEETAARVQEVREEITTLERMERVDGSIAKRLSENISHNIELRAGLERIRTRLAGGESESPTTLLTSLHDFCTQLLNRKVPPNV